METWCPGAVRPCQPLFQYTQLLRAASLMGAIAGAAVQEEEKEEVVREAEVEFMRISGRSWTIKPGLVYFVQVLFFQNKAINDRSEVIVFIQFFCDSDTSRPRLYGGGWLSCE